MPVGTPLVYSSQRDKQLAPLLYSGFLLVGVAHTLLGPILPMLAVRWRLDDAEAGSLFIAQFTGAMIGSALSSPMIERLGPLRLMASGYAAMAAAVACLGVASWGIGLLSVFTSGLALGFIAPATNLLVAEINSERRAAALNIVNFAWALGAVSGPPLIALFAQRRTSVSTVNWTGGAAVRYCPVDCASLSYGFTLPTESTERERSGAL